MTEVNNFISGIQTDDWKSIKYLHADLMCKLSEMVMIPDLNFKDFKEASLCLYRVSREDVDKCHDFIAFWHLLEKLNYLRIGEYDFLIQHLDKLNLQDSIKLVKTYAQRIDKNRQIEDGAISIQEARTKQKYEDVTIKGKIIQASDVMQVMVNFTPKDVKDITIRDNTGDIKCALWGINARKEINVGDHVVLWHMKPFSALKFHSKDNATEIFKLVGKGIDHGYLAVDEASLPPLNRRARDELLDG